MVDVSTPTEAKNVCEGGIVDSGGLCPTSAPHLPSTVFI